MKKADVTLGGVYIAKVSGKLCRVRIEEESPYGGWLATNLSTGRQIHIRGAARLRRRCYPDVDAACEVVDGVIGKKYHASLITAAVLRCLSQFEGKGGVPREEVEKTLLGATKLATLIAKFIGATPEQAASALVTAGKALLDSSFFDRPRNIFVRKTMFVMRNLPDGRLEVTTTAME